MKEIYLDNAAATPIGKRVQKEMARAMKFYGNPSSFNDAGRRAREELEKARKIVAGFLGADASEIVFTNSGSEANNLAIFGIASKFKKGEIITTPIEHPSILEPVKFLAGNPDFSLRFLSVNKDGFVDPEELSTLINLKTLLVSVMYANNEIGTIEPIKKISQLIRNFRRKNDRDYPLFHVDACQAAEYLDMNVQNLEVDLLTFNGSKIYGPRGIGVLYVRRGVSLNPIIRGGEQEKNRRAGTENTAAIMGLAKAVTLINSKEAQRVARLRDYFLERIKKILPETRINGPEGSARLPNNINISIPNLSSENLLLELDKYGIYAGSGSACTSHAVEPSHVLEAIGVEKKYLNGALRFSLGRQTTKGDLDKLPKVLLKIIKDLKKRYKI